VLLFVGLAVWLWCVVRGRANGSRRARNAGQLGRTPEAGDRDKVEADEAMHEEEEGGSDAPRRCVVCRDAQPTFAVTECGHLCMCAGCCQHTVAAPDARCPVCHTAITEAPLRIFRP
jgi:hypothetical protein